MSINFLSVNIKRGHQGQNKEKTFDFTIFEKRKHGRIMIFFLFKKNSLKHENYETF